MVGCFDLCKLVLKNLVLNLLGSLAFERLLEMPLVSSDWLLKPHRLKKEKVEQRFQLKSILVTLHFKFDTFLLRFFGRISNFILF